MNFSSGVKRVVIIHLDEGAKPRNHHYQAVLDANCFQRSKTPCMMTPKPATDSIKDVFVIAEFFLSQARVIFNVPRHQLRLFSF